MAIYNDVADKSFLPVFIFQLMKLFVFFKSTHFRRMNNISIVSEYYKWIAISPVGNFIIGASGSDKQMLCASFGARAAPIIAV